MKNSRSKNLKSFYNHITKGVFFNAAKFTLVFLIISVLSFFSLGMTVKDSTFTEKYPTTSPKVEECLLTVEITEPTEEITESLTTEVPTTKTKTTVATTKKAVVVATSPTKKGTDCYYRSLGVYKITAYCPCEKCCGKWAHNRPKDENGNPIIGTASGARAKPNHTIGVNPDLIPFGSVVLVDGIEYTAEDTGAFKGKVIDVYCSTHEEALAFGCKRIEVFLRVDL